MRIAVVGAGCVGLSVAVLLAQHHDVVVVDVDAQRLDSLARRQSPVVDAEVDRYLRDVPLHLTATTNAEAAFADAQVVIVATPTGYGPGQDVFDTSSVEITIDAVLGVRPGAMVVIASTVPVGFTARVRSDHPGAAILFCPQFLREGHGLYDCLHPSRVVVGGDGERLDREQKVFADLMLEGAIDRDVPVMFTDATEAEAIKLFADTFLALQVTYLNELDTFAATHGLSTRVVVEGVGLDPRIGLPASSPSFGCGGYHLPRSVPQLLANYSVLPANLVQAVIAADRARLDFVAGDVLRRNPRVVGVYRPVGEFGSGDDLRSLPAGGVIERLRAKGVQVIVFEPTAGGSEFLGCPVIRDLAAFTAHADVIVADRHPDELANVADKIYTRDIFGHD